MHQTHGASSPLDSRPSASYIEGARPSSSKITPGEHAGRSYLLISNEKSGTHRGEELTAIARERANAHGQAMQILAIHPGIEREIEDAVRKGANVLVAAGGDGTVAAVATMAKRLELPLGVIPSGTANLFARELGIPLDAAAAFDLLFASTEPRLVDTMNIGPKIYLCHITVGTYSSIARQTPSEAKKKFGRFAYIWQAIRLLFSQNMWTFDLEIDGQPMKRRASTLMITNVGVMGAGKLRWTQHAAPDDGIVEICVIRARTLRHYLELLWSYIIGREHPHLQETLDVRQEAKIKLSKALPVQGDGEDLGTSSFAFHVSPRALRVLAGPQSTPPVL